MNNIRVRFAPSPTGALHIGGARTALFNWLFAKSQGGKFILRIEDTDLARSTETSAFGITEGLKWLGLNWDEGPDIGGKYGPYRQSERFDIYHKYLNELLAKGRAYYCFCTTDEIEAQRKKAESCKIPYRYNRHCCSLSKSEIQEKLSAGIPYVIRLKVPTEGKTVVHDLVRGDVVFQNSLIDDFIIMKSDRTPTYQFAVVVDDALMEISHVIRAEEHLANTPKQLMLYDALGFTAPQFAHISMILSPDRAKLSKRHGATSVQEFAAKGCLPEALLNYLALLGWSPGEDLDILNLEEIITKFNLSNMSKSAAVYDIEKLNWINSHYISSLNPERILTWLKSLTGKLPVNKTDAEILPVLKLLQSRLKTADDFLLQSTYFFNPVKEYDPKGIKKYFSRPDIEEIFSALLEILNTDPFDEESLENTLRQKAENMELKAAALIHPLRLALTGSTNSPGIFEVICLIGKKACIERVLSAMQYTKTMDIQ